MNGLLILAVALLGLANGANDNFKGVATLWGAGITTYRRALRWATAFTVCGSLTATWLGSGLATKFSGAKRVDAALVSRHEFLVAVALGPGATVLLAARLGLPISTTHSLTGALVGAGLTGAGFSHVRFAALGPGIVLPLLLSPIAALILTIGIQLLIRRCGLNPEKKGCICIDQPQSLAVGPVGSPISHTAIGSPALRWAPAVECATGTEAVKFSIVGSAHWLCGAAISFARRLNDTPKSAAVLLVAAASTVSRDYFFVALAIAAGGFLAARVAQTMGKEITPMVLAEAVTANFVAAVLVILASPYGLPVSTTHVTAGAIFGIGLLREQEANWSKVGEILLSWVASLPLGAALASVIYRLLVMRGF